MLRQGPHFRPRLVWLALVALAAVGVPAALGAGNPSVQILKQRDATLASRSRSAVLDLYALQTRLARAQTSLADYQAEAASLRRQQALVSTRLEIARRGVQISQRRLAGRVRALYERGGVDPLAVVLGAESLDEAMTALDSLGQMASGDKTVLKQLRSARALLSAQQRRLAERERRLETVVRSAVETTRKLAGARAARAAYVASLSEQRRLARSAIARLEIQAVAAQRKAATLELASSLPDTPVAESPGATADPTAIAPTPPVPTAAPTAPAGRSIVVVATGYALSGHTATGLPVGWGIVAVDPSVIPLGTRIWIPGYGEGVAADIGSAVRGSTIDLWFPTVAQAQAWGRRSVTVVLH